MTARDVYLAIVVGGGLVGSILAAVGALLLSAAYSGGVNGAIDLTEGVTFFAVGAAFALVSLSVPRLTSRDAYIGIAVGGGLIGSILMAVGALLLSGAYSGGTNGAIDLPEGVTFLVVGAAFAIVSLMQVPARRLLALEGSQTG